MAHPNKRKGDRLERQVCRLALDSTFDLADRTWGSDGRSRGLVKEVDVVLKWNSHEYHVQCKNEETVPNYVFDLDDCDAREWMETSTGQAYVITPLTKLFEVITQPNTSLTFGQTKTRARLGKDLKPSASVHFQAVTRNHKPVFAVVSRALFDELLIIHT